MAGHHDGVKSFVDDDTGYLQWLTAHPDGFVLNADRNPTPAYLVLHRASCHTISGTPARGSRWTGDCIKICGMQHELEEFARANVGGEARACGLCC
ncbi:MAG: hypothetical protein ACRDTT_36570 [Pseudonocardiaceae bacterium]